MLKPKPPERILAATSALDRRIDTKFYAQQQSQARKHFKLIMGSLIALLITFAFLDISAFLHFKSSITNHLRQVFTFDRRALCPNYEPEERSFTVI